MIVSAEMNIKLHMSCNLQRCEYNTKQHSTQMFTLFASIIHFFFGIGINTLLIALF